MTPPRFAADRMLGRLAKWLRILGFDTTYGPNLSGRTIIRHARSEHRILLTRERRTARALNLPPLLYVPSDAIGSQLLYVAQQIQLQPHITLLRRCTRCNLELKAATPNEVSEIVPTHIRESAKRFSRCPACRRVYWPGLHEQRIRKELARLDLGCPSAPDTP